MAAMKTSRRGLNIGNGLSDAGPGSHGCQRNSEYWVHVVPFRVHRLLFP